MSGVVQTVDSSGNQDQPESFVNECGCLGWCSNELQRATLVRECMEGSDKMHGDVRNGGRNTAREVVGEEGMGLEIRISGFIDDTRQRRQETLSADRLPLTKPNMSVGSGA